MTHLPSNDDIARMLDAANHGVWYCWLHIIDGRQCKAWTRSDIQPLRVPPLAVAAFDLGLPPPQSG